MNKATEQALLAIARKAISARLAGEHYVPPLADYPSELQRDAGCFVSLHRLDSHELRGCIGCLEARQSLALCVAEHAVACAFADPRFAPLCANEQAELALEISILSPLEAVSAATPAQLLGQLTPRVHGVVLEQGHRRATFLPQVWHSLPDGQAFLSALLHKGGWRGWPEADSGPDSARGPLEAWRYTVAHVSGPLVEPAGSADGSAVQRSE